VYYNVGKAIHLAMHIQDGDLIKDIQLKLGGIGTYYEYAVKQEARLAVTKKAEVKQLVDLFSDYPLLTVHQSTRLCGLRIALENNVVHMEELAELEQFKLPSSYVAPDLTKVDGQYADNWLVGFVNGEGHFGTVKGHKVLQFQLEHTDKPAVELLKERMDLSRPVLETKAREGRKTTYRISVSSASDLRKVVSFFDNNKLVGHKAKQYQVWRIHWDNKYNKPII
jgi:hypothetical protein